MNRPAIPNELRRQLLVEAGHRCAIPTCRYPAVELHHIVPWESCNAHEFSNLLALCPNCHSRADAGDIDRKSLRLYKARLGAQFGAPSNETAAEGWYSEKISETKAGAPGYEFEFEYPRFIGEQEQEVTALLKAWGIEQLHKYRYECVTTDASESYLNAQPHWSSGSFHVSRYDDVLLSVHYQIHWYGSGAAHPNSHSRAFNYLLHPIRPMRLEDLFADVPFGLAWLSDRCTKELLSSPDRTESHAQDWVRRGAAPESDNYRSVTLDAEGLVIVFDAYQVDCYAAGPQVLKIPFKDAVAVLRSDIEWMQR